MSVLPSNDCFFESAGRSADQFLLKGGMLFAVWNDNVPHRPSRDLDLLGFGPNSGPWIKSVFRQLAMMKAEPGDGLIFDANTILTSPIRLANAFGGARVKLQATLARARIAVQVDIGYGCAVTPGPQRILYPAILPDLPAPVVHAYPVYTVAAEKIHAMAKHGENNTRMKDYYDLWFLKQKFTFDQAMLRDAIRQTFAKENTAALSNIHVALTPEFAAAKSTLWNKFIVNNRLREPAGSFAALLEELRTFLAPVL